MAKLPFTAVVFDLDGVITDTARVHARAWKTAFDEYLLLREKRDGEPFKEFTRENDYLPYVDGKPRYKGVRSFLESRGIDIPFGDPSDGPEKETCCGIGNRKNLSFNQALKDEGADVFESTVAFVHELKKAGVHVGVASSSKNCKAILETAGLADLFETRIDGVVSAEIGLKGKPEGDIFTTAARRMGAAPSESIVVEDATSGVAAGRNGGFGLVLGLSREDNVQDLLDNGADLVVKDMADVTMEQAAAWFDKRPRDLDAAWEEAGEPFVIGDSRKVRTNPWFDRSAKSVFFGDRKVAFFLDYDGTLTPIVSRPDLAVLKPEMRSVIEGMTKKFKTAIVSGRMREDVEKLVGIDGMFYAGSHGFDIRGPGFSMLHPDVEKSMPVVAKVIGRMKEELGRIRGLLVEEKKFSLAVHYRLVDENKFLPEITKKVEAAAADNPELRLMHGKKVFELMPAIEWDKGQAVRWVLKALGMSFEDTAVVYIGDDTTDENAFRAVRTRGCGILVSEEKRPSTADFQVATPDDVKKLFEKLAAS